MKLLKMRAFDRGSLENCSCKAEVNESILVDDLILIPLKYIN